MSSIIRRVGICGAAALGTASAVYLLRKLGVRTGKEGAPYVSRCDVQGWDIAPGEARTKTGERDIVEEASMESFPASDPPSY